MTDAPKLSPCPFCGGTKLSVFPPNCKEDDEYDPKDNAQPIVRCYTCFAEILGKTWDHDMKSAVTAWNTRTDLIPAMLEAARREALEGAAAYHRRQIAGLEDQIAWNDEYKARTGSIGSGASENCRSKIYTHEMAIAALQALAASPPTPTPVDGGIGAETVGKGGA